MQAFPSFPSPTPILHFWLSPHFPRGQNTKNPVLCSQTPRKRLLHRLGITSLHKQLFCQQENLQVRGVSGSGCDHFLRVRNSLLIPTQTPFGLVTQSSLGQKLYFGPFPQFVLSLKLLL